MQAGAHIFWKKWLEKKREMALEKGLFLDNNKSYLEVGIVS